MDCVSKVLHICGTDAYIHICSGISPLAAGGAVVISNPQWLFNIDVSK